MQALHGTWTSLPASAFSSASFSLLKWLFCPSRSPSRAISNKTLTFAVLSRQVTSKPLLVTRRAVPGIEPLVQVRC